MASPPSCFIIATSVRGDVLEVEHVLAAGALDAAAVVDLPDVLERDLRPEVVVASACRAGGCRTARARASACGRAPPARSGRGRSGSCPSVRSRVIAAPAWRRRPPSSTSRSRACICSARSSAVPISSEAPVSRIFLMTARRLAALHDLVGELLARSPSACRPARRHTTTARHRSRRSPARRWSARRAARTSAWLELTPSARSAPDC